MNDEKVNPRTVQREALESIRSVAVLAAQEVAKRLMSGSVEVAEAAEMLMDIASVEDMAKTGWKVMNEANSKPCIPAKKPMPLRAPPLAPPGERFGLLDGDET